MVEGVRAPVTLSPQQQVGDADGAPPPADRAKPAHFTLIQAVRGLAALWVVLFHVWAAGHISALERELPPAVVAVVFEAGHYGVAVFFALSGFVIAYSLRDIAPSWRALGAFTLRRSLRLDPPYWASIATVIAFGWLSAQVKQEAWAPPTFGAVLAHLAYLQEFLGIPNFDTVYWTLTYEIQFYLFFAFVLIAGMRLLTANRAIPLIWGLFYIVALGATADLFDGLIHGLFLELWNAFFVGALAYAASVRPGLRAWLLVLVAAMLAQAGWNAETFPAISALTALLFYASLRFDFAETALDWRWVQFLGTVSYSLYLLHNTVIGAAAFLLVRTGLAGTALRELAALVMLVALSIAAAALFWAMIERPSHNLSRRVAMKRRE